MQHKFDLVFIDPVTPINYDSTMLNTQAMGGTEASILRVAIGMAKYGLKVAILQHLRKEESVGNGVYYLPLDYLEKCTVEITVHIRSIQYLDQTKDAKQLLWMHDLAQPKIADWLPKLKEHDVQVIAVSRWHEENLRQYLKDYKKLTYIYNPLDEKLSGEFRGTRKYNKDYFIWAASPHKGLFEAIELFKQVRQKIQDQKESADPKLIIFNPGYLNVDQIISIPGVHVEGPVSPIGLWQFMQNALCVFYPTQFEETFGCIAAEANAVGTPILTCRKAALMESVSGGAQLVNSGDDKEVIRRAVQWYFKGAPKVKAQKIFYFNRIIKDWARILQTHLESDSTTIIEKTN